MKSYRCRFFIILIILLHGSRITSAQEFYLPINRDFTLNYESHLYRSDTASHTAIRPFLSSEVNRFFPVDSIDRNELKDSKFNQTWVGRKLRREHLLEVRNEDYTINLDPAFEQRITIDTKKNNELSYINTRGFWITGTFGKRFSYQGSFYESQGKFPDYLDSAIRVNRVVPGGARPKRLYDNFDYAIASGTVSYSLKKYFNFQFGHDRVFIGDGYRSLLLSDNAFNFPFLKITTTFWKIKYMNLYAVFQDMKIPVADDENFRKKYGSFHFLDINIGKRFSFGILEAIIWKADSVRAKSFDINYINPFVFFRPVEFSLHSPDNAMIGFNLKYKITGSLSVYSQLMLDEFKISQVRAGNGWWANKQAVQFGAKYFDVAGIKNLHAVSEFNFVRPYTYQHKSSLTAYAHYNQSITHPLGANFWESVSIVNYKYKNFFGEFKIIYAKVGYDMKDSTGKELNYGQNIFKDYFSYAHEYGNKVAQGLTTRQWYNECRLGYIVNPKYNFIVEAGITSRIAKNEFEKNETLLFFAGIRTALTNRYFDF